MGSQYTAYLLHKTARKALLDRFPPRYSAVKADHITHEFGAQNADNLPQPRSIEIIGIADDGKGIEALVISIDGKTQRPDGGYYHITWSLENKTPLYEFLKAALPDDYKGPPTYRPVHSNALVKDIIENPDTKFTYRKLETPVVIDAVPAHVNNRDNGTRDITTKTKPPAP